MERRERKAVRDYKDFVVPQESREPLDWQDHLERMEEMEMMGHQERSEFLVVKELQEKLDLGETLVHLDSQAGQVQKVRRVCLATLDLGERKERKEEGVVRELLEHLVTKVQGAQ